MGRRVAFYAPMKAPDHPNPSGDRRIAKLLMRALDRAGWEVDLASRLRSHQREGNSVSQDYLFQEADRIVENLTETYQQDTPLAWFTYHCYYKAPDLYVSIIYLFLCNFLVYNNIHQKIQLVLQFSIIF